MNDLVVAIILGRKGSKGVRDKNVMEILKMVVCLGEYCYQNLSLILTIRSVW